jgi:hypothetical protein
MSWKSQKFEKCLLEWKSICTPAPHASNSADEPSLCPASTQLLADYLASSSSVCAVIRFERGPERFLDFL